MNTHEHPSDGGRFPPCGTPEPLSRRRFIVMSATLLGTLGLPRAPFAADGRRPGPAGGPPTSAGGTRERALWEADLYRPHALAG